MKKKGKPLKGFEDYTIVDTDDVVTFGTTLYLRNDGKALKIVFPAGKMCTFAPVDEEPEEVTRAILEEELL